MKNIGPKITYNQTPEKLLVNISAKGTKRQIILLTIWLVLWTIAGTIVITQLFMDYPREQKLFLVVWMVFWLYFEWKVYYTLRWRKGGLEIIKVEEGKLTYSRQINGMGKVKSFDVEQIRNMQAVDYSDKFFEKAFYKSYWSTGGEALAFYYSGQEVRFGMQIAEKDAKELKKVLEKAVETSVTNTSANKRIM